MFNTVLVANRGEIACRIITACQELGIVAVAVFSDVDRQAPHVQMADRAVYIGEATPASSYLNIPVLIKAAARHEAQAVHPGYGFLSENEAFANAVAQAGMTFIGPRPEVIGLMGNKTAAKNSMIRAGVPVIPGEVIPDDPNINEIEIQAQQIGYPVMVKAAAGGGGKGMRIVHSAGELEAAIEGAGREALAAFGNGSLLLEKYLDRPRHIEFQILGDHHGNIIHLFERECSIQRRYQKIIEESPSTALTPVLRQRMGEAAVTAARAVGYTNAGTVEFIYSKGDFFFLEMNTRLQVEHPITEAVCGVDLVKWQLKIADGQELTLRQEDLSQRGHAVECRIYAEDPEQDFLPAGGRLHTVKPPHGVNVRNDMGVETGNEVSTYYDPMLAKLIVWDEDRPAALAKMGWALDRYVVLGTATNIPFLREVMGHPAFASGDITTHFIPDHFADYTYRGLDVPVEALLAAALADSLTARKARESGEGGFAGEAARQTDAFTPWRRAGGWRIGQKKEVEP